LSAYVPGSTGWLAYTAPATTISLRGAPAARKHYNTASPHSHPHSHGGRRTYPAEPAAAIDRPACIQ